MTARATDRSKEVGLRKVLGAIRKQLAIQFMVESVLFTLAAAAISVLLLQVVMPVYTNFLGYTLLPYFTNPWFYIFILGVTLVVGIVAGSYPALLLSSFSPNEALRSKFRVGKSGAIFRKSMVVLQFGISVLLITCVTVVVRQMHFIRNTDLGFSKEQSLIIRLDNGDIWTKKLPFKSRLLTDPGVSSVSLMSGEPGGFHDGQGFESQGRPGDKPTLRTEFADFDYAKTLGLKLIAGRDFSADFPADSERSVLVNRTAATFPGIYAAAGCREMDKKSCTGQPEKNVRRGRRGFSFCFPEGPD